jgi:hypothetical protein
MNWPHMFSPKIVVCALASLLASCAAVKNQAAFEAFGSPPIRASRLHILEDVHASNPRLESRVAEDLREALAKRGFQVLDDPTKADLVLLPTLGRIREENGSPQSQTTRSESPARTESRFLSPSTSGMTQAQERSFSHSARASFRSPEWRVGLLLTAYDRKAYMDFNLTKKALNPVWRVYACMAIDETSWQAASKPLIESIAASVDANLLQAPEL